MIFRFGNPLIAALLAAVFYFPPVNADLTNKGPFAGHFSEGFESFPDYHNGGNTDTLSIAYGNAMFRSNPSKSDQLYIINPPFANWFLGGNRGMAGANSGARALGLFLANGSLIDVTLTFDDIVQDFGFYFLTADGTGSTEMTVSLFDAMENQLGSDQVLDSGGNVYQWAGWSSATGIKSVRFTGNEAPVIDDIQFNIVPESTTGSLTFIVFACFVFTRRKPNCAIRHWDSR